MLAFLMVVDAGGISAFFTAVKQRSDTQFLIQTSSSFLLHCQVTGYHRDSESGPYSYCISLNSAHWNAWLFPTCVRGQSRSDLQYMFDEQMNELRRSTKGGGDEASVRVKGDDSCKAEGAVEQNIFREWHFLGSDCFQNERLSHHDTLIHLLCGGGAAAPLCSLLQRTCTEAHFCFSQKPSTLKSFPEHFRVKWWSIIE